MYAKVYNLKFSGISEAKIAATFCSDAFGKMIVSCNMRSLNISIGQYGSLTIQTKFEESKDLKIFEKHAVEIFGDLRKTIAYRENHYSGVYVFNFEAEATDTSLALKH